VKSFNTWEFNMTKIDLRKQYRTRGGENVKVLTINAPNRDYPVVVLIGPDGDMVPNCYTADGRLYENGESVLDLIEYSPYSHIKIDDPVIYWESDMNKFRGYFAGIDDEGRPMTYIDGKTKWSSGGRAYSRIGCTAANAND
jgi:hypothetical protein